MCGLFGYSTKKGVRLNHEKKMIRHLILNRLGIEMQTRGNHSSGVVFLEDKKIKTYKGAKSFARLREMPLFEEFTFNSPIIIGHTRAATMGAITPKNAHPFIKGSIVGVHNGIINSPHDIYPQAEVDSEAIFELLNKEKNDVEKVFPQLAGSMAVVWMNNEQPNKVFFLRHQNPLVTAEISDLDTVFWASTEHGLKSAIEEVQK